MRRINPLLVLSFGWLFLLPALGMGCGSSANSASGTTGANGGSSSSKSSSSSSGSLATGGSTSSSGVGGSLVGPGPSATSTSTTSTSSTSGTSTSGTASTGSSSSGGATCPIYQSLCNGVCIPTSQDPSNCGGCGVVCTGGQVCSGSACSATCLPGTTACNGACVDTQDDNANCGGCGMPCGAKQGCSQGVCVTAIGGTTTSACTGSGPSINLGGTSAGCVAQTTFTWGVCSCNNVGTSGDLLVDGYDSTKGPYKPGGLGAGLGINNALQASTDIDIWGPMWTYSTSGLATSATVDIKQETRINGAIQSSSKLTFEENAFVNGGIATSGSVAVTDTLTVPPAAVLNGNISEGKLTLAPVTVAEPCDCGASSLLPIAAWVAAAKATNDDLSIALSPDALVNIDTPQHLDLPCGVYYLSGIATSAPLTISAHGNTALFIDGDVSTSQPISFVLDPTAQFDVVVGGTIGSSASIVIGSPNYPALSRTYIGSTSGLNFSGPLQLGGNLYVGYGPLGFSSSYTMYGALFAADLKFSQAMNVHFDRSVVSGGLCDAGAPPGDGGTGTSSSGTSTSGGSTGSSGSTDGGGAPACTSCKGCGNQACVQGQCGSCTTDSDCCAPLQCLSGTCELSFQ